MARTQALVAMLAEKNIRKAYKMAKRCSPLWKPTKRLKRVRWRQFPNEVAIVLLAGVILIEIASIFSFSKGVTSDFQYPADGILDLLGLSISLLGLYGLSKRDETWIPFALSASAFWMVLGCFTLVNAYSKLQLNLVRLTNSSTVVALGALTLACIFKGNHREKAVGPTLDASSALEHSVAAVDEYAVETVDVVKTYFLGPNVVSAINGVSLRIRRGEFVAVMGPSGSGKSTLLNLIGALDRPISGQVLIDGVDISTLDEEGLARLRNEKIGFVFQAYNLIGRSSVLRNMELPALVKGYSRGERLDRVNRLLTTVGLDDKGPRKPQTLSGGEQQRVAIARALINDPEIVLADEPTGNVDSKTGRVIIDFLRRLNVNNETTVVVVTHDPEVASKADRIINLRDGRIISEEHLEVR